MAQKNVLKILKLIDRHMVHGNAQIVNLLQILKLNLLNIKKKLDIMDIEAE
jgi:hypothetical protein